MKRLVVVLSAVLLSACGSTSLGEELGGIQRAVTSMTPLTSGQAVTGLSGPVADGPGFSIAIPAGTSGVQLQYAGSGSCQLRYLPNTMPTATNYKAISTVSGECSGAMTYWNPPAGTLYLHLVGTEDYSSTVPGFWGASLTVTLVNDSLPGIASFTISPTSVTGTFSAVGTATLTAPAPFDFTAPLTDNHPKASAWPDIEFAAGATSGSVHISTSPVGENTTGTFTVTSSGTSQTASLTVVPSTSLELVGLTLSPSSVEGGASSIATLELNHPAPSGGLTVSISPLNSAYASAPATVTFPAGQETVSFTITTQPTTITRTVYVRSSYGQVAQRPLTITPTLNCVPTTCAAQGKDCGTLADGCGGTLTCGSCSSPLTCGGGGVANVCGQVSTSTLTVSATGRSGEFITSSPSGLRVNVGGTGSMAFPTGTSVTLTVSNGRTAVWSGGCSSNGNRTRSCTVSLTSSKSVNADVR